MNEFKNLNLLKQKAGRIEKTLNQKVHFGKRNIYIQILCLEEDHAEHSHFHFVSLIIKNGGIHIRACY